MKNYFLILLTFLSLSAFGQADVITFEDKDKTIPAPSVRRLVRDVDLNEIKNVVNANAALLDLKATISAVALKANLNSPIFTGVPSAPTAAPGTNTTQIATTAFVTAAVGAVTIGDGDKTDITVSSSGAVWNIDAGAVGGTEIATSVALAGSPTTTTQSAGDNSTKIATTAYTDAKVAASITNGVTTSAPNQDQVFDALAGKQATLVSGTNIKTINGTSVLGSGDISTSITSEVYNIGLTAVGDGVADDRAAIQNAYDAGYTAGYRIFYLPAGTYLMSLSTGVGIYGCLFIKPGTTLFGDGDNTIIQRDDDDLLGVTITYDKTSHNAADLEDRDYTLRNFKIQGTTGRGYETPIGTSETEAGIFLATATNRSDKIIIEGVTAVDLNKEAIAVWDAVECIMRNNKVYNCNFDAYNPQLIESLVLTGNYAYGCNIAVEYDGRRTGGIPTHALIEGNEFVDIYEYGIGVEAGDHVKISNNILVGQTGSTTVTYQSIGIYILPNQGNIDLLEVTGNQIVNFIQGGLSNSVPVTGDYVLSRLIAKGNTFLYNGENCVRLKAFSTAKILHTEISGGNTFINWNRIDNGTSVQWSAIHLENIDNVSVHGNTFRNITNGKRNDPLFLKNTSNVRFFDNDCTGPPSEFNATLEIKTQETNTGTVSFNNAGLSGNAAPLVSLTSGVTGILQITNGGNGTTNGISSATQTALNTKIGALNVAVRVTPSGTVNGVNTVFVLPDDPAGGTDQVFINGLLLDEGIDYEITVDTITFDVAPETDDDIRVNYIRP